MSLGSRLLTRGLLCRGLSKVVLNLQENRQSRTYFLTHKPHTPSANQIRRINFYGILQISFIGFVGGASVHMLFRLKHKLTKINTNNTKFCFIKRFSYKK